MADTLERLRVHLAGRYRIERELGRGGMAIVYLADDLKHRRRVAVKVLLPEVAAALGTERFLREIEIAARLTHPRILPLHDSGAADGLLYYVMPYVEGESLRERITREKQLPLEESVRIAREVAAALEYAHGQGVVHRDIKPENILLAGGEAVVADFGIARAVGAAAVARLTTTGVMVGTPAYASPEQVAGESGLDARSDIYSLGCVLYEMLGGEPPFTGPTAEVVIGQHLNTPPPDVRALRPAVPGGVSEAVKRALAKLPADRYASAGKFVEAISRGPVTEQMLPAESGRVVQVRSAGTGRRSFARATLVMLLAAAAVATWLYREDLGRLAHRREPPAGKKDWILVAEFRGPSDEPDLGEAARSLVGVALDQSSIIATVSREQIRIGLERAGKPDTARLTPALARELAFRASIRTVLEGEIRKIGKGYSLAINVTDAEDGKAIVSLSEVARDRDALVEKVERLGHRLRRELGERRSAIAASRPLVRAATPSFEAYQQFVRGRQLRQRADYLGALPYYQRAVALDSTFAKAWQELYYCSHGLGKRDSSFWILQRALAHADRLDEMDRQSLNNDLGLTRGDLAGAVAAADRMIALDPYDPDAWDARAFVYGFAGRFGEAGRCWERAAELSPFGPPQYSLSNAGLSWIAAGRIDRARALLSMTEGNTERGMRLAVLIAAEEWAAAESLGVSVANDPTADPEMCRIATGATWSAAAARGEITKADSIAHAMETTYGERLGRYSPRNRLQLLLTSGRRVPILSGRLAADTTAAGLILRGLYAVAIGDLSGARRLSRLVRTMPPLQLLEVGASPDLLDARIAAAEGRWEQVLPLIARVARTGLEAWTPQQTLDAGSAASRLALADAFEHLGQPESTAVYLELALAPSPQPFARAIVTPFVRQRLILLYARMGRLVDARRHMETLDRLVDSPDPDVRARLEEAKAALASAEGIERSRLQ